MGSQVKKEGNEQTQELDFVAFRWNKTSKNFKLPVNPSLSLRNLA